MQWDVLISAGAIAARVREVASELRARVAGDAPVWIAVERGALPFARAVLAVLEPGAALHGVTVSSYQGGTRPSRAPCLLSPLPDGLAGRTVVLFDDVLDTGATLHRLRADLLAAGAARVWIAVLLRKRRARVAPVEADFVGFEIDDVFVVGYGLDYQERYRDLPHVAAIRAADAPAGVAGKGG